MRRYFANRAQRVIAPEFLSKRVKSSVPIILDQYEASCRIRLEGEINISSAAELKKLLLEALSSGKEIRLDMERATELDVTALQLVWAVEREAKASGVTFVRVVPPQVIAVACGEAGFEMFPILADPN